MRKTLLNGKNQAIRMNLTGLELKTIDKIAYIRFSSVFRRFVDVEDFEKEVKRLIK